ncbi:hypothetical protein TWF970_006383 [Orbilia oligospora]|uniref:FHA domain-containing protein n=1 Tax=Orbilia oligospora TaxID=2813651 RepID=A0A7C8VEM3_ORBOL|nr:hypothetical protein TWF970_006383 [Orbilia oligospora]
MGRWDSTSPTRARSRSPRDNSGREGGSNTRDDRRDRDRDGRRKGSRWEDEDKDRDRNYRDREDKERRRVVGQGREKDGDKDRERRRRDDGGSSRRDRDRDRERDRDRGGRDKERNRSRDRTRDRKDRHRDDDGGDGGDGKRKQQSKNPSQEPEEEAPPKEAPNFNRTTHLVSETNTFNGVVLKYVEPPESRLPPSSITYRLYVFKSSEILETITLSTRTAWLFGRDRLVADVPIDHPSASKQHAVIQFRFVTKVNEYGEREGGVKPYVIDLGSANGTTVNGETVPEKRYFELKEKDIIGFGHSSRDETLESSNDIYSGLCD